MYTTDKINEVDLDTLDGMRIFYKESLTELEKQLTDARDPFSAIIPMIIPSYREILSCIEREIVERTLLN